MLKIDEKLANAIANYLGARPFAEVYQIMVPLLALERIEEPSEATEKAEDEPSML